MTLYIVSAMAGFIFSGLLAPPQNSFSSLGRLVKPNTLLDAGMISIIRSAPIAVK